MDDIFSSDGFVGIYFKIVNSQPLVGQDDGLQQ